MKREKLIPVQVLRKKYRYTFFIFIIKRKVLWRYNVNVCRIKRNAHQYSDLNSEHARETKSIPKWWISPHLLSLVLRFLESGMSILLVPLLDVFSEPRLILYKNNCVKQILRIRGCKNQGCGSGSDPDSVTLWIRIRIGNPDPDPGARKWRNFRGKMHFIVFF
jgi:hypothetical protein